MRKGVKWAKERSIIIMLWTRSLLHPKSILRLTELSDRTMGCRTSASPVICSVRHHDYSVHPSVPDFRSPYVSCFRSSFCFMFPFLLAFSVPFYFQSPSLNPDPDICPILVTLTCSLWYLYVPILMYVPQSEIDIDCPSNSPSEPPNLRLSLARNSRTVGVWWHST